MSSAIQLPARDPLRSAGESLIAVAMLPIQAIVAAPPLLFILTMTVMLFRPPDVKFMAIDRVLFAMLVLAVLARICVLRLPLRAPPAVTWPMLGLLGLSLANLVGQPFEAQNWSVFAAKWVVPLAFYILAGYIFETPASLRTFESFALLVLGYLCFTAMASLAGATALIFPRYILDSSLGIHADRARGPFLQAVANGVSLNLLGLVAVNAIRRGRLRGVLAWLVLAALPVAIIATKTRAVWLAFAGSVIIVLFIYGRAKCRMRSAVVAAVAISMLAVAGITSSDTLLARIKDGGPLEYRVAVYDAGWQMFTERPVLGWPADEIQTELYRRISGFKVEAFYLHDTYLEIAVQHGLLGLALYMWVIIDLLRLGRTQPTKTRSFGFLIPQFRPLWRVMVLVYLFNATFVVMNYQFVNALLFTVAGLLAAQNRRIVSEPDVTP